MKPTANETQILQSLHSHALAHRSGGTFDVVALLIDGKERVLGKNRLCRPADTIYDGFKDEWEGPYWCGVHAELDCYRRRPRVRNGFIYVVGARSGSRILSTTKPCPSCQVVLHEMGVRWAVYYLDGQPTKSRVSHLLQEWEAPDA